MFCVFNWNPSKFTVKKIFKNFGLIELVDLLMFHFVGYTYAVIFFSKFYNKATSQRIFFGTECKSLLRCGRKGLVGVGVYFRILCEQYKLFRINFKVSSRLFMSSEKRKSSLGTLLFWIFVWFRKVWGTHTLDSISP